MLSFMRKLSVLFIVLICMVLVCGCTTPSLSSQPAAPASQPVLQSVAPVSNGIVKNVIIRQRSFDPDIITISRGTTVVWTNEDPISHRVVHLPELPSDKELFHSEALYTGDKFTYTFQTAGRYYYGDPQYAGGRKSLVIVE
jgi:plastocyanin